LENANANNSRFDKIAKYLIADMNIDHKATDNVGKAPLDMVATTPGYQKEIRDFIAEHENLKKKSEKGETTDEVILKKSVFDV
jgi:hypothetical protein